MSGPQRLLVREPVPMPGDAVFGDALPAPRGGEQRIGFRVHKHPRKNQTARFSRAQHPHTLQGVLREPRDQR